MKQLKVYETVVLFDLEDWGISVNTEIFLTEEDAMDDLEREFKKGYTRLNGSEPDEGDLSEFADEIDRDGVCVISNEESNITFELRKKEVKSGETTDSGERQ